MLAPQLLSSASCSRNGAVGPVVFCSLLGIAMALSQSPGRHPHLDRCEQGAPLFGRELARAKGLVPYLGASLAALCYAGAQTVRGSHDAPFDLVIALAAVAASTLDGALRFHPPRLAARTLHTFSVHRRNGDVRARRYRARAARGIRICRARFVFSTPPIRRSSGALRPGRRAVACAARSAFGPESRRRAFPALRGRTARDRRPRASRPSSSRSRSADRDRVRRRYECRRRSKELR